MVKYVLYLDSRNSTGANNGQCVFALNQSIIGATSCKVLMFTFANQLAANTMGISLSSSALVPSSMRYVNNQTIDSLSLPFYNYIVSTSVNGSGDFESSGPTATLHYSFQLSGQNFNMLDVTIRDSQSFAVLTGFGVWSLLLEFEVPPFEFGGLRGR